MRYIPLLCSVLAAAPSFAGSIYLNGVKIDGVTNQKFEKATVRIDEKGNVMIDAPGYRVQQVEGGTSDSPSGSVITRHYFLVTEQTAVGMTDYDVDIYVNGKYVRKL